MLFFHITSGVLVGTLLGLILAIWLQRRGWLGRKNRWHHLLLKLYFLALPCIGGFLGVQAGLLYAAEKQIHREIDRQQPLVELISLSIMTGFHDYLGDAIPEQKLAKYAAMSPRDMLLFAADDFARFSASHLFEDPEDPNVRQRMAMWLIKHLINELLVYAVDEVIIPEVVRKGADYTYLNADTLKRMSDMPFDTLFNASAVLDFSKRQVSRMWFQLYLAVALEWLAVLAVIGLEFGIAWYFGQYRRRGQALVTSDAERADSALSPG